MNDLNFSMRGIDKYKNIYVIPKFAPNEGQIVTQDGIECLCVHENPWLLVDRNHNLNYYFSDRNGYEWGIIYKNDTNESDKHVAGEGLRNTNRLLSMIDSSHTNSVLWVRLNEFRQSHSDTWYVPTTGDFTYIAKYYDKLNNFNTNTLYWSSNDIDTNNANAVSFGVDLKTTLTSKPKTSHVVQTRLLKQWI